MEIKLLSCPLCLKPHFENVAVLRATLISVATSQLACPICSENFMGLDKLTIHLFTHMNNEQRIEEDNLEGTKTKNEVDENISSNTCDQVSISQAKDCTSLEEQLATNLENLVNVTPNFSEQNNTKNKDSIEILTCDICDFSFTDKNILDMHQKLLHQTAPDKKTGLYSYHCHLCSKKFKMKGSLMVHLRVAHFGFYSDNRGSRELLVQKKIKCENEDGNNVGCKMDGNKQWECETCSKSFTTKYFLKKHKRLHTGEMPYSCAQCNKSFTFQQSYHKHMLYHSSDKPHSCTECGRSFKELSTLQNHARIHSGEKPFGCETCGKRFRQRVSYLVHRRIHTGVMPYKCTACKKTFRYKVSQRAHKCNADPPGTVIRISDVPENTCTTSRVEVQAENRIHCYVSVEQDGTVNFVPNGDKKDNFNGYSTNNVNNYLINSQTAPDLYSMVESLPLPEVESLTLSSPPTETSLISNQYSPPALLPDETFKLFF